MGSCCSSPKKTAVVEPQTKPAHQEVWTNLKTTSSTVDRTSTPLPRENNGRKGYVKFGLTKNDPSKLIEGYEKEPLVSLEEALQPVQGQIDRLSEQIQEAKGKCHHPSQHGLTRDESAAIYIYTMRKNESCVYNHLEHAWKTNDRSQMKVWFKYLKLLRSGLNKLPNTKTEVWQGIPYNADAEKLLQSDSLPLFTNMGSGASSINKVKEAIDDEHPGAQKILIGYSSIDGKDVTGYTSNNDKETLIWPGMKLKKTKVVEYDQNGSMIVHVGGHSGFNTPEPPKTPMTPRTNNKSLIKHFLCPMKGCTSACRGDHEGNHCYGFAFLTHSCSHHCGPLSVCSNPHCRNITASRLAKNHRLAFDLRQCNKCKSIFCEDCCFK